MRINQNIAAMNAYRNLSVTQGQQSRSLERLSSGFRINRAADDAAGLAISEKLRGQVGGLNQAVSNAQNGISLIQTAEGALNESHSILQRMRELAVQSANDTNTDADRTQIQKEVDQLSQELSRIGSSTEFNTKKLLDGSLEDAGLSFQIGANEGQTLNVKVGDVRGFALGATGAVTSDDLDLETVTGSAAVNTTATTTESEFEAGTFAVKSDGGTGFQVEDAGGAVVAKSADGLTWTAGDGTVTPDTGDAHATFTLTNAAAAGDSLEIALDANNVPTATLSSTMTNSGLQAGDFSIAADGGVTDSTGAAVGTYDGTNVTDTDGNVLATMSNGPAVGTVVEFSVGGTDVSSSAAASEAITTIQTAIDTVSDQRSTLGAVQNRLDHTINNLNVASENLSASESRIRDTDMAAEMMNFTRAQILSQAGTAMLAQANQVPQSVLSLLR